MVIIAGYVYSQLGGKYEGHILQNMPALRHLTPIVLIAFVAVFGFNGCSSDTGGDDPSFLDDPVPIDAPDTGSLSGTYNDETRNGFPLEGTYFYHPNHLGSASYITDTAGTVITRYYYKPYGEIIRDKSSGADIVRHKFTGQEEDAETGLMYYGARYYDPYIGNFITPDSLIPEPEYSQSFNRYMYTYGNPVRYNDPSGHAAEEAVAVMGSDQAYDTVTVMEAWVGNGYGTAQASTGASNNNENNNGEKGVSTAASKKGVNSISTVSIGDNESDGGDSGRSKNAGISSGKASGSPQSESSTHYDSSFRDMLSSTANEFGRGTGMLFNFDFGYDWASQGKEAIGSGRYAFGAASFLAAGIEGTVDSAVAYFLGKAIYGRLRSIGAGGVSVVGVDLANRFAFDPTRVRLLKTVINSDGTIRTSQTVLRQLSSTRSYITTQSIHETIGSGVRIADPQGVAGQFLYKSNAIFNGSRGTLEVLIHEPTGVIRHVLFRSGGVQ